MGTTASKPGTDAGKAGTDNNSSSGSPISQPINIVLTADVYKRWIDIKSLGVGANAFGATANKIQINPPPATEEIMSKKISDENSSKNENKQMTEIPEEQEKVVGGNTYKELIGGGDFHSRLLQLETDIFPETGFLALDDKQDLEQIIWSSKEFLRNQSISSKDDRVVLGVGPNGKSTFETVGIWKIRKEKEEELRENYRIWSEALELLKEKQIKSISEGLDEVIQNAKEIQEKHLSPKPDICVPLCMKVSECYSENKNNVFNCRQVVQEFTRCVQSQQNS